MKNSFVCNKCKRNIKLKPKHIKTVTIEDDIERQYFKCPHCNAKYTIIYTNKESKENFEKLKMVYVKLADATISEEVVNYLVSEEKRLKNRNLEISNSYKKIYDED